MQKDNTSDVAAGASRSGSSNIATASIDLLAFNGLVDKYQTARKSWNKTYDKYGEASEEQRQAFAPFMSLERQLVSFPCSSAEVVSAKASLILGDAELLERLDDRERVTMLLSSLLYPKGGAA